jgi:hypothetical protein
MPESGSSRGSPSRLVTFLKLAASQIRQRRNVAQALDPKASSQAQQRLLSALESARGSAVRDMRRLQLKPSSGVWTSTGIRVSAGDTVTLFSWGAVWLSKLLALGFEPATVLWVRVSGGPMRKMVSDAMTFRAQASGEVELFLKPLGEWMDQMGQFDPKPPRLSISGEITAVVVAWSGDAEQGLVSLQGEEGGFSQRALAALREDRSAPPGWSYLWRLGEGQMFRGVSHNGAPAVRCHTQGDVGILQYPVDVKLEPGTELQWSWCMERLPSALPEHIRATHDYMSIAAEFENEQDLTYFWSAGLPEGHIFRCPLPWWCERETHMVLRSGRSELGQWKQERRNLYEDYQKMVGGPRPSRVVRVWLIAVSVFQRQPGTCLYQDITVGAAEPRQRVL